MGFHDFDIKAFLRQFRLFPKGLRVPPQDVRQAPVRPFFTSTHSAAKPSEKEVPGPYGFV